MKKKNNNNIMLEKKNGLKPLKTWILSDQAERLGSLYSESTQIQIGWNLI